jgi:two-component system response regulator ChvI
MPAANPAETVTVAVVDDDPLLLRTVASNLEEAGFRVAAFGEGQAVLDYLSGGGPASVILLDWQMPVVDGPEVLRRLRSAGHAVPVIFLTGHNQPIFEEAALAGGAVDFVDKSRSFSIVLKRLRLAIAGAKGGPVVPGTNESEDLSLDHESCRAFWRGAAVDLTISEFKVVRLLAGKAGRDVSYREIYDAVRGEGFQAGAGEDGYRANVRALVKRVRQKFRDIDPEFESIANYPGFGYRWSDGGAG